jgi:hypothetical protein
MITKLQTTVYQAEWRGAKSHRYLAKDSAIAWLARQMFRTNPRWACCCEPGDYEFGGGFACDYHRGLGDKLEKRLVRYLKYCAKATP